MNKKLRKVACGHFDSKVVHNVDAACNNVYVMMTSYCINLAGENIGGLLSKPPNLPKYIPHQNSSHTV